MAHSRTIEEIPCRRCGYEVRPKTGRCPVCRVTHPTRREGERPLGTIVLAALLVGTLVLFLLLFVG